MAAENPERFARIVVANGGLPTGDFPMPPEFLQWQEFSQKVSQFQVGRMVSRGCTNGLSKDVIAAYDAPFPDESYKEGPRILPSLVPTAPDDPANRPNRKAFMKLRSWEKPFLTAFSDGDPITHGADALFQKHVPGAAGQPHTTISGAGHFLQEDKGLELAQVVVEFMQRNPLKAHYV
jgi:haloalkane dehalogenase